VLNMCDLFEDDYKEFVPGELTELWDKRLFRTPVVLHICRLTIKLTLFCKIVIRISKYSNSINTIFQQATQKIQPVCLQLIHFNDF